MAKIVDPVLEGDARLARRGQLRFGAGDAVEEPDTKSVEFRLVAGRGKSETLACGFKAGGDRWIGEIFVRRDSVKSALKLTPNQGDPGSMALDPGIRRQSGDLLLQGVQVGQQIDVGLPAGDGLGAVLLGEVVVGHGPGQADQNQHERHEGRTDQPSRHPAGHDQVMDAVVAAEINLALPEDSPQAGQNGRASARVRTHRSPPRRVWDGAPAPPFPRPTLLPPASPRKRSAEF